MTAQLRTLTQFRIGVDGKSNFSSQRAKTLLWAMKAEKVGMRRHDVAKAIILAEQREKAMVPRATAQYVTSESLWLD